MILAQNRTLPERRRCIVELPPRKGQKHTRQQAKRPVIAVAPWSIAVPVENAQGCKSKKVHQIGAREERPVVPGLALDRLVERWETLTKEPRSGCLKKQPQASGLAALLLSDCTAPVRFRFYASSASFSRPLRLLGLFAGTECIQMFLYCCE